MIEIEGLKKRFGQSIALDEVSMHVRDGAMYGFVGPNGAGKTTTIRCMMGLLAADGGKLLINGIDMEKEPKKALSQIGYIPDDFGVYDNLKVLEYMEFFASCYGITGLSARKRSMTFLDQVGLEGKSNFYVDRLSKGMKQRLCLARALVHNPSILIMDEPTAGLDPRTRVEFKEILKDLKDQKKTVFISSHILSELSEVCTDIGIIDEGKVVLEAPIDDILNQINISRQLVISVSGDQTTALKILRSHPCVGDHHHPPGRYGSGIYRQPPGRDHAAAAAGGCGGHGLRFCQRARQLRKCIYADHGTRRGKDGADP